MNSNFSKILLLNIIEIYEARSLPNQTDFCWSMRRIHVTNFNQFLNLVQIPTKITKISPTKQLPNDAKCANISKT